MFAALTRLVLPALLALVLAVPAPAQAALPLAALPLAALPLAARSSPARLPAAHPPAARPPAAPSPTTDQLAALAYTLRDPAARQLLIEQIDALIAARGTPNKPAASHQPQGTGEAVVMALSAGAEQAGAAFAAIARLRPAVGLAAWARSLIADQAMQRRWITGAVSLLAILALALLAEHGTAWLLAAARRRLRHAGATAPPWLFGLAALSAMLLRWLPILVFIVVGYAAVALALAIEPRLGVVRLLALAVLNAGALTSAIVVVAETLLAPHTPWRRALQLREETASYWLIWIRRLVRFTVYCYFALNFVLAIGLDPSVYGLVIRALGLIFAGLLSMLLLQNRAAVARSIRGRPAGADAADLRGIGGLRTRIADAWHIAAMLYLLACYAVWAARVPGGFAFLLRASLLSAALLLAARLAVRGCNRLSRRLLSISPDLRARFPGLDKRVNLYAPAMIGIGDGLICALAAVLALQIWGLNVLAWLANDSGQRVLGATVAIAMTALVATVVWEAVSLATEIYLTRPGADGTPMERSARARTLLPLFHKTVTIVLGVIVALVVLDVVGVNIGPLLAGAGIAGIAIGFGAQSLVKDVITGLFVLMQDAVAVGDVVTVAGCSGLVERVSIRSIRLRDISGTVIVIPFSEVTTVRNMTKDFSYAVFEIGIAYRENVDAVIEEIKKVGADLRADPAYSLNILDAIEILGLDRFDASAVVVKARIKTRPIKQWSVMREFNRRLKQRFDECGIELPFPHQTIYFGTDRNGEAPPAHILLEAAAERGAAIREPEPAMAKPQGC